MPMVYLATRYIMALTCTEHLAGLYEKKHDYAIRIGRLLVPDDQEDRPYLLRKFYLKDFCAVLSGRVIYPVLAHTNIHPLSVNH